MKSRERRVKEGRGRGGPRKSLRGKQGEGTSEPKE